MTHLHIPDGIIPPLWWILGMVLTGIGIAVAAWWLKGRDQTQLLPVLGVVCAVMLIVMNVPLIPGYHLNFSVLAGIMVGPALGFMAAFIVVLLLALVGHGGLTTIGLNTLIIGSQCIMGWAGFQALRRLGPRWAAGLATFATLLVSSLMLVGVVALADVDPDILMHHHDDGGAEPAGGNDHPGISAAWLFARVLLVVGLPGWVLESVLVALVVSFIARLRPDLLGLRQPDRLPPPAPAGGPQPLEVSANSTPET